MPLRTLILTVVALSSATGQQVPVAAKLVCPPANQTLPQDPAVFTWTAGSQTPNYRLLLGPSVGSSRDGDSSLITGLQGQLAGLPQGQNLYVTLWSYDQNGNPVEPPSSCAIKTAQQPAVVGFKDVPGTALAGVSLGSFAAAGAGGSLQSSMAQAAQACQAKCKENTGCQGYTFYPAGPGNPTAMCDLKSQITQSQPDECCLSALKIVTRPIALTAPPSAASVSAAAAAPVSAPTPARAAASVSAPAPAPVKAPAAARAPASKLLSGEWVNQFGAISRIVQKGDTITGTYSDAKQPELSGSLQGTFDGTTLHATLKWKAGADSSSGSLLLTLTPQGRLDGTWTDAKGVSGPWNMGPAGSGAR